MSQTPYPPPQDSSSEERELARKRLEARRALTNHAVTYVVVNAFLIGIWYFNTPHTPFWPGWVLGGWGIGLALNAWNVLGRRPITESDIEREMRRGRG